MISEVSYQVILPEAMDLPIRRSVQISWVDEDLLQQAIVPILWLRGLISTILSHVMSSSVSRSI